MSAATLVEGWLTSFKDACYTIIGLNDETPVVEPSLRSKGNESFVVSNSNLDEGGSGQLLRKRRGDVVNSSSFRTTNDSTGAVSAKETEREARRLTRRVGKTWPDDFYEKTIQAAVNYLIIDKKGSAYAHKIYTSRQGGWDMTDPLDPIRIIIPLEDVRVPSPKYIIELFQDFDYVEQLLSWNEYYSTRPEFTSERNFMKQMMMAYTVHMNSWRGFVVKTS